MKNIKAKKSGLLIIGVGNTSRGDDALGWDFVSALETEYAEICDFEYRYQLQVEDSELISFYDKVVIIDASHEDLPDGFEMKICLPAPHYYFSSHAQKADTILYLANEIYGAFPTVYTMAISGYHWELDENTSAKASQNFEKALQYFRNEFSMPKLTIKPVCT
jgi:hydrogenase maturation protease